MDKRVLSVIPKPVLTDKNKEMLLLVPHMRYLATASRQEVNGIDTLIINFFRAEEKELRPEFRTFCQMDDYISQDLTTDKIKWKTGAVNYLTGYLYWYRNSGNIVIASVPERKVIFDFFSDFRKRYGIDDQQKSIPRGATVDSEIENRIDEYQDTIKEWKLAKRYQKEKDYIDNRMTKFGKLPEDYDFFVENSVFQKENYIFYSLPAKRAYCTRCKHDFIIDNKKHIQGKGIPIWNDKDIIGHNRTVRCPWCNSYLKCKSEGMGKQGLKNVRWSVLIQKSEEDVLVRYFRHIRDFSRDFRNPEIMSREMFRTIHTAEKAEDYEWYRFKSTQEIRWCILKDRSYGYFQPSEYDVPRRVALYNQDLQEAVTGTCMRYSSIDLYVEHVLDENRGNPKPWFVDWYFNAYRKSPFLEQMLKVGFYRMVREFLDNYNAPELIGGRSILDSLGINKIQYNMLCRLKDPSLRDLDILKYKPGLSWDDFNTLRHVNDNGHYKLYRKFADFMRYTTLHKLTRYLSEQKIYHEYDYFDYAKWIEEMGYDMRNEFNLYPKDFKKAHDDKSKEYVKFKDERAKEDIERFNKLLKKLRKDTSKVDAMNLRIEGMFVRLPVQLDELKREGEILHHCVGTYVDKVAKGETMIFFIRQESDPDKPFFTLEWKGRVVQCRGFKNCNMTPEVKAFVNVFENKMQEYEKKPEKKHRKVGFVPDVWNIKSSHVAPNSIYAERNKTETARRCGRNSFRLSNRITYIWIWEYTGDCGL